MEPTPPQDPNLEQPAPAESQKSPELKKDAIVEELKGFIEGEPMGTTKSKAFCDAIDIEVINSQIELYYKDENGDEKHIHPNKQGIEETIRQRKNELPGYKESHFKVRDLSAHLFAVLQDEFEQGQPDPVLSLDSFSDRSYANIGRLSVYNSESFGRAIGFSGKILGKVKSEYLEKAGQQVDSPQSPQEPSEAPPSY